MMLMIAEGQWMLLCSTSVLRLDCPRSGPGQVQDQFCRTWPWPSRSGPQCVWPWPWPSTDPDLGVGPGLVQVRTWPHRKFCLEENNNNNDYPTFINVRPKLPSIPRHEEKTRASNLTFSSQKDKTKFQICI